MKKFRQLAALFLAFAMVIGVFSTPKIAKAAETLTTTTLASSAVTIDYVNECLVVTKASNDVISYATKYAEKSHAKTAWEEAYVGSDDKKAIIDFSNTSPTKEVVFYLTNDTEKKPIEIKVAAQETTLAVSFSGTATTTAKSKIKVANDWTALNDEIIAYATTTANPWAYGYLNITVGGKSAKALTASDLALIEYRKGTTGAWDSVANLDVRKFTASGAQLYFRIKATNTTTVASGSAFTKLGRTSKEVKVTYAKQANAPKVTIDGATKEVKLAKTLEYRVGVNGTYQSWISVADNHYDSATKKVKKVYLKQLLTASGSAWLYTENTAGQSIQVRTAASDKGVASKVATITLNQVATPTVGSGAAVQFSLVKNTTYDKGITVQNTTGPAIQVAVVSGSSYDVNNTKTVKWIAVKAGGKVVISGKELAKGDTIITRTATIKDNTKTVANEFKVSSDVAPYAYKSQLPLATQTFAISNPKLTATVTAVTASAVIGGTSSPYTVTVTNTATASAITVLLDVATTNVVDGAPKIACVASASNSAAAATATTVKLATVSGIKSNVGQLKITITDKATASDSRTFRVTVDGHIAYITVNFVNGK